MSRDPMAFSDEITFVGTTQLHPLDTRRVEINATYGRQEWRYVKNNEGATTLAIGNPCMHSTAQTVAGKVLQATTSVASDRIRGVAQHAIVAGSYGWILRRGNGLVLADATGFTADTGLIADASTAGCAADTSGVTAASFAFALAANAGSTTAIAYIHCM